MILFQNSFCIEAPQSEVADLFRSQEIAVELDESAPLDIQVFVCSVGRQKTSRTYVVFNARKIKRSLVYAVGPEEEDEPTRRLRINQGIEFAEKIGACMKSVDLKHSSAMREVLLKEAPVLPPEIARQISSDKTAERDEMERLVAETGSHGKADGPVSSSADSRDRQRDAVKAAAGNLAREKRYDGLEEKLRRMLDDIVQAMNSAGTDAGESAEELKQKAERAERRSGALEQDILILRQELADAQTGRDMMLRESRKTKIQREEFEARIKAAEERAAEETERRKKAELSSSAAEKELENLRQKISREEARGNDNSRNLEREIASKNRRINEMQEDLEKASKRFAAAEKERETLASTSKDLVKKVKDLERALFRAKSAGGSDKEELEKLKHEKSVDSLRIRELESALKAGSSCEDDEGKNESENCRELITREAVSALREALRSAETRVESLHREIRRLNLEHSQLEKRNAFLEEALEGRHYREKPAQTGRASRSLLSPSPRPDEPSSEIIRRPPPPGAVFHIDWNLSAIPCASPEEICEIQQSVGMVQLFFEGFASQYCTAWLVTLKEEDCMQVYLAFHLAESKRLLIHAAVKRPDSPAAFKKTLKEAHRFLNASGIELEAVPLGRKPENILRDLEHLFDFNPSSKNAGNF